MEDQSVDAYKPAKIAELVENIGVTKAVMPTVPTIMLGLMAGAFIAFGAMFYTLVMTNNDMGLGPARLLGGLAFSLGLILVLVGGAELFTGNNFIVMAWAEKKVTTLQLLRNWSIVYIANFVGAVGTALLIFWSGVLTIGENAFAENALNIAVYKTNLDPLQAFIRGILCNALVCLSVWICFAARDVASKILAIIFPVSAFVALGFEHCIANMYFIPLGMILSDGQIGITDFMTNIIPVTAGNIVGGSIFVAFVYWIVYVRDYK
ncbi:MAG: formate/nitrite transporter family protein [Gammaproteobacteria bacterium]|nr:formate/nitrite transporter family protein [Gammaproteobacteria bacterium]